MHSPARRRIPFTAPVWRAVRKYRFSYHYLPPLNVQVLDILLGQDLDQAPMFGLNLDHAKFPNTLLEGLVDQIMLLAHVPDLAVITELDFHITCILSLSPCSPRPAPRSSSTPWPRRPHFLQKSYCPRGQCNKRTCRIPSVRPRAMYVCGRIHVPR
jgi:hypothetical protein